MNRNKAFREAVKILKDEANSLAVMHTEQASVTSLPPRAKVAIQREIDRLREIAEHIEGAMIEGAFNEENADVRRDDGKGLSP